MAKILFIVPVSVMLALLTVNLPVGALGFLGIFFLLICLFARPHLFVAFWFIFAAVSNKIVVPGVGVTSYGVMNAILLPAMLVKIAFCYRKTFRTFPLKWSYLAFVSFVFISIFYSSAPLSDTLRKFINFIIPYVFSIIAISQIEYLDSLKKYLKLILTCVAGMGALGVVMYLRHTWVVYTDVPRAIGVLDWPNDYALFLNMNFAVALSLYLYLKDRKEKFLYGFLATVILISMLPTFSKSGYSCAAAVVFVSLLVNAYRQRTLGHFFGAAAMFGGVVAIFRMLFSGLLAQRFSNTGTFHTRADIWESVIRKFFEHPVIGNGFRSSLTMVGDLSQYKDLTSTHNLFLMILLELGVIGLVLFLAFYASSLRHAVRIFHLASTDYERAVSFGFIALLICVAIYSAVGNAFLTPMVNLYFWFYLSLVICLANLEKRDAKQ